MKQYIYNEQNGLWYELWGDYYIPCLELPTEKEERHIGKHQIIFNLLCISFPTTHSPHGGKIPILSIETLS